MIEWMQGYYMSFVMCGAVSLLFTVVGGWVIMKGLETLKGDMDEPSTAPSLGEEDEATTEDYPRSI